MCEYSPKRHLPIPKAAKNAKKPPQTQIHSNCLVLAWPARSWREACARDSVALMVRRGDRRARLVLRSAVWWRLVRELSGYKPTKIPRIFRNIP